MLVRCFIGVYCQSLSYLCSYGVSHPQMNLTGTVGNGSHDVIALDDFKLYPYTCSQGEAERYLLQLEGALVEFKN